MFKKCIILISFLLIILATAVTAYWSDVSNISYKRGDNYSQDIGVSPIPKTTSDEVAQFEAYNKSSWSTPKACLVNSEKQERSNKVDLETNRVYTTNSWAEYNYYYYYKIIGSWNQLVTDKLKYTDQAY